jgi:hypothetical protein
MERREGDTMTTRNEGAERDLRQLILAATAAADALVPECDLAQPDRAKLARLARSAEETAGALAQALGRQ